MKVLIISDSHGLTDELQEIRKRHEGETDAMFHCGDSELEADHSAIQGYTSVRGNCDFEGRFANEVIEDVEGYRFFVAHGHLHNVKSTLMNVMYSAKEHDAKIVCFGHSHLAGAEYVDNILFINPGSIRLPRMRTEKTYVILEIQNQSAQVTFFELDGSPVTGLSQRFELASS
ncbi:metallophosphoesterase [Metabacillus idriensis]|uniref:Phosphoesterase n=1 Tax=Metabacillus idriensis TaxID=324768 RepID=A0A6I2MIP8_9BACI|nr:metallophosphoesterase [Metabacillus idriensis]MCM3596440.1 metallophosphoesterase [Metabacillus idriensis]MRX56977.1 YfcE family phosphodiesterase [Metabacillus idriensis]OHR68387.1 metallophosphatase [Bacillus sp. HMSC76G11]